PTFPCQLSVLVLGELEVGLARRRRERTGNRTAAVELPESKTERDRVGEPRSAAAEEQLPSCYVHCRVRNQRDDEHHDTQDVEDPDESQERNNDLPPATTLDEAAKAQVQRGGEASVRSRDH